MSRSDLAGIALLAMILASALFSEKSLIPLSGAYPFSGITALIAGILLFPNLRVSARIQVGLLFSIGSLLLIIANSRGVSFSVIDAISRNALLLTILCAHMFSVFKNGEHIEQFVGYPVTLSKLWLPVSLTVAVVSMQALLPSMPILVVISLSALLLSAGVLWMRLGAEKASNTLYEHALKGLPRSSNELLLFLSAGVLATGLSAFLESTDFELALTAYTLQAACITLAIMIMTAAAGIHPVIQISVLTPLLLPINPDPELLAMTFLFAWALGNAASPLSGTHLMLQGRYNVAAWKLAVQNWPYVFPMYFVAIALLALQTAFKQA